jgi:hypothetical protein
LRLGFLTGFTSRPTFGEPITNGVTGRSGLIQTD